VDRPGAPEGWLEGAPDAVGCPKTGLMVMMISKGPTWANIKDMMEVWEKNLGRHVKKGWLV
jgi:hypothetical protein